MDELSKQLKCRDMLQAALDELRENKPDERSETARRFAVTITELEKVLAYFSVFVVNTNFPNQEVK